MEDKGQGVLPDLCLDAVQVQRQERPVLIYDLTPGHIHDHVVPVGMNMARGKVIYQNGEFKTLDLDRIKAEVKQYALPLIFR